MNVTASHPALIAHCRRSPRWRLVRACKSRLGQRSPFIGNYRGSAGRAVVSFEYLGEATLASGRCQPAGAIETPADDDGFAQPAG